MNNDEDNEMNADNNEETENGEKVNMNNYEDTEMNAKIVKEAGLPQITDVCSLNKPLTSRTKPLMRGVSRSFQSYNIFCEADILKYCPYIVSTTSKILI